jgi:hypothetical protein
MSWQIVGYRHPVIYVRQNGGKTYRFHVNDDRSVEHVDYCFDAPEARRAAISYLAGCRRWFGHWIPVDPGPTARV